MLVQAELFTLYCVDESLKDLAKMQTLAQTLDGGGAKNVHWLRSPRWPWHHILDTKVLKKFYKLGLRLSNL